MRGCVRLDCGLYRLIGVSVAPRIIAFRLFDCSPRMGFGVEEEETQVQAQMGLQTQAVVQVLKWVEEVLEL